MRKNILIFTALIAAAAVIFAGCGSSDKAADKGSALSDELAALGSVNRFAGVVVAGGEDRIDKQADRNIAYVAVSVGDDVAKDQVLFAYDGAQAQSAYDKAAIELAQLRLSLDSYYEQRSQLEAEKASADGNTQLEYTIQIQEVDTSIREAGYNITVKEKEVQNLEAALYTLEIKAPAAGKVQSINTAGTDGAPFMVISRTDALKIKTYINEENISELTPGASVIIRSRTTSDTWTGKVNMIDSDNPQTNSDSADSSENGSDVVKSSKYPVYITLDSSKNLMLGQHVYVELSEPGE